MKLLSPVSLLLAQLVFSFAEGLLISSPLPPKERDAKLQIKAMAKQALRATLAQLDADVLAAKEQGVKPNCTRDTLQIRMEL